MIKILANDDGAKKWALHLGLRENQVLPYLPPIGRETSKHSWYLWTNDDKQFGFCRGELP